jgi:prepilin-type N-terminal cleavage/methylation domain-containing protein
MRTCGFTLVELAVVIVIIALLIGGITAGSTLVAQAELRTVISEIEAFGNAYTTFKTRYKLPPGDLNTAFSLWGSSCGASSAACNGNGNYAITANYFSIANETAKAWKHLDRANLLDYPVAAIPGTYTGILNYDNSPKSKARDIGYYMASGSDIGGDFGALSSPFNSISSITNGLFIGTPSSNGGFTVGALTASEAFAIDKKIDDAVVNSGGAAIGANTGSIRTIEDQLAGGICLTGGNYNITSTGYRCVLGYRLDK